MELFNELPEEQEQAVEDFLTFIGIYESVRRHRSLRALLKKQRKHIEGKTCLEAGAGKGIFSREMIEMGASKVFAVERSAMLRKLLAEKTQALKGLEVVASNIEDFEPDEKVHTLFHEFYGSLVLDESMLALRKLRFSPDLILPDGGRLWAMPLTQKQISEADPGYDPQWKDIFSGALISDVFLGVPFKPLWEVFYWDVNSEATTFRFTLPEESDAEFLAFCGEISHQGKKVLNMWYTHNWPIIYTPVAGKTFEFRFEYAEGYTKVFFEWVD